MFVLELTDRELYDETNNEFMIYDGPSIRLEHSLASISKWEAIWKKPFLSDEDKSFAESVDYIRCMTINANMISAGAYTFITDDDIQKVSSYISASMTATVIYRINKNKNNKKNKKIITSEVIYYWMITFNIPSEYQYWHLDRLLTLINVCSEENSKSTNMSQKEIMDRNTRLNAERKKALGITN